VPDQITTAQKPLTRRQQEVLALVIAGLSDKEIAAKLKITTETAKTHVLAICGAWGVATREELYLCAADEADTKCSTCTATTEARSLARLLGAATQLLADINEEFPWLAPRKAAARG
jgi:DNA-binding CsgD family transcriptional regulator